MRILFLFISVLFALTSCVKNNQDPSWIEVSEWQLEANPDAQYDTGVLTSNITEAWVYVDGKIMGVFEVPFKIPVLMEGSKEIQIFPAVKNNGISVTKKIYPFLEPYIVTVNLTQNEVVSLNPVTRYYKEVQFWIEDFEDASFDILDAPGSLVSLGRTDDASVLDPAVNEAYFGRINLDETNFLWQASTIANNGSLIMDLPRGKEVYLEIDYHNTNSITAGVLAIGEGGEQTDNPYVTITPQETDIQWKKIYIDLRDIVSGSVNASYFEFSFISYLDEGSTAGEVNIDNIKAVYF